MAETYDLVVIGGGSGGVACARRAAAHGARVALCEESRLGGTCVIRGCVPKKLMHYGAHFAELFHAADGYGWTVEGARHDWDRFLEARNREIDRLNGIYRRLLDQAGVTVIEGHGRLQPTENGLHVVVVGNERLRARHVLVAVGARPALVDVPGIEHVVTSDAVLEGRIEKPERAVVVGAGYIGLEVASILNGFGVETHLVFRADLPLRGFDLDLRIEIASALEHAGVHLHPGGIVKTITRDGAMLRVEAEHAVLAADCVVYATGREPRPNTAGIGLEALDVQLDETGAVQIDQDFESNLEGVFAIGDCSDHAGHGLDSGSHDLTPVAIAEGRALAERLFANNPQRIAYDCIPTAVFSLPEVAAVGMSEENARAYGYDVAIYRTRFKPMLHTLTGIDVRTLMKLVVDRESDRVLGCHMVGADAAEIVQGLAVALTCGATKADFDATVALHPTAAEEFVTLYQPVEQS